VLQEDFLVMASGLARKESDQGGKVRWETLLIIERQVEKQRD
jgi:hypothetical protein